MLKLNPIRSGFKVPTIGNVKFSKIVDIILPIIIFAAIAALFCKKMWNDGVYFEADDLRVHITWLQHFHKQLSEGDLYPRWLGDINYGYGSPTFVFYPPVAYYLGSLLIAMGADVQQALILLSFGILVCSGITAYCYCRRYSSLIPALGGAIAYISAPYVVFNIFMRFALAESLALAILPLGFLLTDIVLEQPRKRFLIALFYGILILTHLPSLLIFTTIWVPYVWIQSASVKSRRRFLFDCFYFMLLGCCAVAFYFGPVLVERSLVSTEGMKAVGGGFSRNFVIAPLAANSNLSSSIKKIISIFNPTLLLLVIVTTINHCFRTTQKTNNLFLQSRLYLLMTAGIIFLISVFSRPFWEIVTPIQMIQFPWRFLGLFSFFVATLYALTTSRLLGMHGRSLSLQRLYQGLGLILLVALLAHNAQVSLRVSRGLPGIHNPGKINYAADAPGHVQNKAQRYTYVKTALEDPFSSQLRDVPEYLPQVKHTGKSAEEPKLSQPPVTVLQGEAKVEIQAWRGNYRQLEIVAEAPTMLEVRTYFYPAWKARLDGQAQRIKVSDAGTMRFEIPTGKHELILRYRSTLASQVGSVVSALALGVLGVHGYRGSLRTSKPI